MLIACFINILTAQNTSADLYEKDPGSKETQHKDFSI